MECEPCILGKHRAGSHQPRNNRASSFGEEIHLDSSGRQVVSTPEGYHYFCIATDSYSNYSWVKLLRRKSDAYPWIDWLQKQINNRTGRYVASLRTDNEFNNKEVQAICQKYGTMLSPSAAYDHNAGRLRERMNLTYYNCVRAMLQVAAMPRKRWGLALKCLVATRNLSPSTRVKEDGKVPFELIYNKPIYYSQLRVFGERCYPHVPMEIQQSKLDARGFKGRFVGYGDDIHTYLVMGVNGDVRPYSASGCRFLKYGSNGQNPDGDLPCDLSDDGWINESDTYSKLPEDGDDDGNVGIGSLDVPAFQTVDVTGSDNPAGEHGHAQVDLEDHPAQIVGEASPRASQGLFGDGGVDEWNILPSVWNDSGTRRSGCHKALRTVSDGIPQTIRDVKRLSDASKRDGLIAAMERMWQAYVRLGVVNIVPRSSLPPGSRPIKSRSIFVEKLDEDGNHVKFKYCAVPKGFLQREGVDYISTTSPTGSKAGLRMMFSIAAANDWEIDSTDTVTAFLLADIDVPNLTMEIPSGMSEHFNWPSDSVWKVNKAIEGFRQSSKCYYEKMNKHLTETMGMTQCPVDPCCYFRFDEEGKLIAMLHTHVDDQTYAGTRSAVNRLKAEIEAFFPQVDNGPAKYVLGLQLLRCRATK